VAVAATRSGAIRGIRPSKAVTLQELRLEALKIRIDADPALGRHAALVAELEALTSEHPLRERLRAARMLALMVGRAAAVSVRCPVRPDLRRLAQDLEP
jgi:hypothetical protein